MALARFALKNLSQRVASASPSLLSQSVSERTLNAFQKQRCSSELLRRLSSAADEEKPESREVSVSEGSKKSKLFPRRRRRGSFWRRKDDEHFPSTVGEFLPSGLGNALYQASENINKLFESLSPSRLLGRFKEHDEWYKLRFIVPGIAKDDVKITVEDGILVIRGERKEVEEEEGSEDDHWSAMFYGNYYTSVMLPEDAKVDEIKAELKDGVLTMTVPRTEKPKKDVQEVPVH